MVSASSSLSGAWPVSRRKISGPKSTSVAVPAVIPDLTSPRSVGPLPQFGDRAASGVQEVLPEVRRRLRIGDRCRQQLGEDLAVLAGVEPAHPADLLGQVALAEPVSGKGIAAAISRPNASAAIAVRDGQCL